LPLARAHNEFGDGSHFNYYDARREQQSSARARDIRLNHRRVIKFPALCIKRLFFPAIIKFVGARLIIFAWRRCNTLR
jgi:hypothetical protein